MSPDEAMSAIQGILTQLKGCSEEEFANAATKRSDCGSCANGGDLGAFGRGMMQKPFEVRERERNVAICCRLV